MFAAVMALYGTAIAATLGLHKSTCLQ